MAVQREGKVETVCVFCGAHVGRRPVYADAARELGVAFADRGIGVVFGGGHIGLMGVLADAVLARSGRVVGVIPESLRDRELAHDGVTELHVVKSMHERKALMADLSDAFVALPGGLGTLEELLEVTTWRQLRFHERPIGLLNLDGYYDPLLAQIERAVEDGFVDPANRGLLAVKGTVPEMVDAIVGPRG